MIWGHHGHNARRLSVTIYFHSAAKCLSVAPSRNSHKSLVGLFCLLLLPLHVRGVPGENALPRQTARPQTCPCAHVSLCSTSFKGELMRQVFTHTCSIVYNYEVDTKFNIFEIIFQASIIV